MTRSVRDKRGPLEDVFVRFQADLKRLALAAARTVLSHELERRSVAAGKAALTRSRAAPATRAAATRAAAMPPTAATRTRATRTPSTKTTPRMPVPAAPTRTPAGKRPRVQAVTEPTRVARTHAPRLFHLDEEQQLLQARVTLRADVEREPTPAPAAAPAVVPESPALAQPSPRVPRAAVNRIRGRVSWTRGGIIAELASWISKGTTIDARYLRRNGPRGLVAAARREFGRFEAAMNVASLHNAKQNQDGAPQR